MDYAIIWVPRFDGDNYLFWRRSMQTHLKSQGYDVWKTVVDGYKAPTTPLIDKYGNGT
jgi:hypothetical protein